MIAASPAKGCGPSCLRSCAGEEGSSWPSGASCRERGGCDDHILSDGRLHLSPLAPGAKEQVRSMRAHDAVERLLTITGLRNWDFADTTASVAETVDGDHGRIETR